MQLVSIGDQVGPGAYRTHSCFRRAANFTDEKMMVSVVGEEVGAGPRNIVVTSFDCEHLKQVSSLRVGEHAVALEEQTLCFTDDQRYSSDLAVGDFDAALFQNNLQLFARLLRETSAAASLAFLVDQERSANFQTAFERAFARHISQAANEVFGGDLLKGVRALKGCGMGLTPSGDDLIAGLLIGLNVLEKTRRVDFSRTIDAVLAAAVGDNIFSNAFLDMAAHGSVFGRMKDLIAALMSGNTDAVRTCTHRLFAIGSSSGADLGTGFYMTVINADTAVARFASAEAGAA